MSTGTSTPKGTGNYYEFPWHLEESTYREGDKRLSVFSEKGGRVGDVYRQTAHSDEEEWKAMGALMTIAPELMAVVRAVSKGKPCKEYQDLANSLVDAIEKEVDVPKSFWNKIDNLIEEIEENSIEEVRDLLGTN